MNHFNQSEFFNQNLELIESELSWFHDSSSDFHCLICKKMKSGPVCKLDNGWMCQECAQTIIKDTVKHKDLSNWSVSQFLEALSDTGQLRWRFMVLWRFNEIVKSISDKSPLKVYDLMTYVIVNLGYTLSHPLSQAVRQIAYDLCLSLGESILPQLIKMYNREPWQFCVNIIMVAIQIAPDQQIVKNLIEDASKHINPEVRNRIVKVISNYKFDWSEKILTNLINDNDPSVQLAAQDLQNVWKLQNRFNESTQITMSKQLSERMAFEKELPLDQKLFKSTFEMKSHLEILISEIYSLITLRKLYTCYLYHLFDEANFTHEANFSVSKLKKPELVNALSSVFSDKHLFHKLLSFLPEDIKKILLLLIWEGGKYHIEKLEKDFNNHITKTKLGLLSGIKSEDIHDKYLIFQIEKVYNWTSHGNVYNYYFFLSDELRKYLKQHLSFPEEAELTPVKEIPEDCFIYENKDKIIDQLRLLIGYVQQGHLKISKNKTMILKSSIKEMSERCRLIDFYDNKYKELAYLRTRLIAELLIYNNITKVEPSSDFLKDLLTEFFYYNNFKKYLLYKLLNHIKGGHYDYGINEREKKVRQSLKYLFNNLPVLKWISIENIIKYAWYKDIYLEILDKSFASRALFFLIKNNKSFQNLYESSNLSSHVYKNIVIVPFLKAVMFLFAAFGIFDIAYSLPENQILQKKDNKYLSIYDGLQYVRLTKLGAYVLGRIDDYYIKVEEKFNQIQLDENRLIIYVQEKNTLAQLTLEKIGVPLSKNCYKINHKSFLRKCSTQADILNKIKLFKEHISSNPPDIWQTFLDEIFMKTNPLTYETTKKVFKLNRNEELISLITQDDILKKYILKAEDYYIIIDSNNLQKIKNRLEHFGFFIDNL
jgi:hypothetical protein